MKYLGAYLGLGDLTHLNFEKPLCVAWNKLNKWNKHKLTLPARVVILKTFIFSLFTHIINIVFITQKQLSLIQNILNDFLWHGHATIKQSTACAPVADGGLSMINVKNTVHCLRVKWVH